MKNDIWMAYGKEPFDLRLTMLCMCRRLPVILAVALFGTVLFGGGYYVKNVLFRSGNFYTATSVYQVEYAVEEEKDVGAVYINEASWNTYLQSEMFLDAVRRHLAEGTKDGKAGNAGGESAEGTKGNTGTANGEGIEGTGGNTGTANGEGIEGTGGNTGIVGGYDGEVLDNEALREMLHAYLASDLRVPSTVVTTDSPEKSIWIARAVEEAMIQEFAREIREIVSIKVIDPGNRAKEVIPDVRVGRAFVLSAVLSSFFITVIMLLQIIGEDGIRLPSTIWKRYGIKTTGTIESRELAENLRYFFRSVSVKESVDPNGPDEQMTRQEKICQDVETCWEAKNGEEVEVCQEAESSHILQKVAVCAVQEQVDADEVLEKLRQICPEIGGTWEKWGKDVDKGSIKGVKEGANNGWFAVPAPLQHPEYSRKLRSAEGILLVVQAGAHGGRQFEHVLEYLRQQDCKVTAAILWKADEKLIHYYYMWERKKKKA